MSHAVHVIHVSSGFTKAFQKLPSHIQSSAVKKDLLFRKNVFTPSLRTHKLKGPLEGYWAYSINRDYRVLFRFTASLEVLYLDVGTHQIYR